MSRADQEQAELVLAEMAQAAEFDEDSFWDFLDQARPAEPADEFSLRVNLYRLADLDGHRDVYSFATEIILLDKLLREMSRAEAF